MSLEQAAQFAIQTVSCLCNVVCTYIAVKSYRTNNRI